MRTAKHSISAQNCLTLNPALKEATRDHFVAPKVDPKRMIYGL